MLERIRYENREDWLNGRSRGIGASEAAAVVGKSKWQSAVELWRLKTGRRPEADLRENEAVQTGIRLEGPIRNFWADRHPEYRVEHHPFDMLYQRERPWLYATLDGEIRKQGASGFGVLEIKTATPRRREDWDAWDGRVPDGYYCQVLHQMLATGCDFVVLSAGLIRDCDSIVIKDYEFYRSDCEDDLAWLLEEETRFWRYVEEDRMPPMKISL